MRKKKMSKGPLPIVLHHADLKINGKNFLLIFKANLYYTVPGFSADKTFSRKFWDELFVYLNKTDNIQHYFAVLLTSEEKVEVLFVYVELPVNSRELAIRNLFPYNFKFSVIQRNKFKEHIDNYGLTSQYKLSDAIPVIRSAKQIHHYLCQLNKLFSFEKGPFFNGLCWCNRNLNMKIESQPFVRELNLFDRVNVFLPKRWEEEVKVIPEKDSNNLEKLLSKNEVIPTFQEKKNNLNKLLKVPEFSDNFKKTIIQLKLSTSPYSIKNLICILQTYMSLDKEQLDLVSLLENCSLIIVFYLKKYKKENKVQWLLTVDENDPSNFLKENSVVSILISIGFKFNFSYQYFYSFLDNELKIEKELSEIYYYKELKTYTNSTLVKKKILHFEHKKKYE